MASARFAWVILAVLLVGCGGDDAGSEPDAAGNPNADASTAVSCPPTDDLECEIETSVCVEQTPVGPASTSSCEPVPTGCDVDRTCECVGDTLCQAPFDTCEDFGDNRVRCVCVSCQ